MGACMGACVHGCMGVWVRAWVHGCVHAWRRRGAARRGVARRGMAWRGVARPGVAWRGQAWRGVAQCACAQARAQAHKQAHKQAHLSSSAAVSPQISPRRRSKGTKVHACPLQGAWVRACMRCMGACACACACVHTDVEVFSFASSCRTLSLCASLNFRSGVLSSSDGSTSITFFGLFLNSDSLLISLKLKSLAFGGRCAPRRPCS